MVEKSEKKPKTDGQGRDEKWGLEKKQKSSKRKEKKMMKKRRRRWKDRKRENKGEIELLSLLSNAVSVVHFSCETQPCRWCWLLLLLQWMQHTTVFFFSVGCVLRER